MKNNSKNNYSNKFSNKKKEGTNRSEFSNFSNSRQDKDISKRNSHFNRKLVQNRNELNYLQSSDKHDKKTFSSLKRNVSNKSFHEKPNNFDNKLNQFSNKKNFEDWIWGKHSVFAALSSQRAINRIWCTSEIFSSEKFYTLLKELKSDGVLVEEVSWSRLSQLTYGASHQGIALQFAASKSISLVELIEISKSNATNPIIIALDGITDPHNLGAIIRSAEAFDCKGIILPQRRSAGLTGTVAKVAAGALEYIPVSRVVNLNRAIDELKRSGYLIVGLSGEGQLPISKFNEKSPCVVIVGAEDKGISLITQKKCDFLLRIPLKGKTSSLNASVAAAISLFHLSNR